MTPELSRRLGRAVGRHLATIGERARIANATLVWPQVEVWADLPADIQALVEQIETRPLT